VFRRAAAGPSPPTALWSTTRAPRTAGSPSTASSRISQVLVDTTLLGGGTVVLHDSFDADDTLAAIEDERITDLFLVEPQLFELMDHPDLDSTDMSSLRAVVHIGVSAPPTLRRRARERLGPVVAHTYGASEIGIVSALSPAEYDPAHPERFSCAGRIHPGVDVRFRRPDATLAEDGEAGSIEVRSPAMAAGYRNRPVEQAAAFRDGWYRTGDLGRLDDEGYLHILGRAADITWTDGVMISPPLIQETLPGVGRPNSSLHDAYYDPDFLLTVNGLSQDLAAFRAEHDRVQRTGITFAVTYDEDSWVEGQDCIAGRIWITTHPASGRAARIEVLFVAACRSGRLLRLTALNRPDPILPGALDT
jgi:acyl-CoA synthetase (AMP-forming)/AMP-acid ligase II